MTGRVTKWFRRSSLWQSTAAPTMPRDGATMATIDGAGTVIRATGDAVTTGPPTLYAARQEEFARERDGLTVRWNRVANLRLLAFILAVACAIWAIRAALPLVGVLAALLLVVFLVLVRHHAQLGVARRQAEELRAINEEAGWRLRRDWARLPLRSARRAAAHHLFASDLDLFGPASLSHLLYPGGTRPGEAALHDWLLTPADPPTILARQGAVAELAPRIDLRDRLQMVGRVATGASSDPEPFLRWAEGEPWLIRRPALVWAARLFPVAFWVALILWLTGIVTFPFYTFFFFANVLLAFSLNGQVSARLVALMGQEGAFRHYAASFGVLDGADFPDPTLARLEVDLSADGLSAYRQMGRLERLCRLIIPPSALSNAIMQSLFLWNVQVLVALEGWQVAAGGRARRWLGALGEVEALAALGGLAHAQPEWTFPVVAAGEPVITATALGHPLLADGARVSNDLVVGPAGSFVLVTGSNMSGKSTLLRSLGLNEVLAGAGGPVCAGALRTPSVALWTSMRIQDSLAQGVSYYMAELQRLKAIVDAAGALRGDKDRTMLYLLDEILQGTNTAERQIAARRIISHLVGQGALGVVSTHDLALADAPEIATTARPIYFTEEFAVGPDGPTMRFDYQARPGIATSTNALTLMQIVGLNLEPTGER